MLRELYPDYKITRTMINRSKRHRYYATESEEMMRTIAETNSKAAEILSRLDREKEIRQRRIRN